MLPFKNIAYEIETDGEPNEHVRPVRRSMISYAQVTLKKILTQLEFFCSRLAIETIKQGVKYVQS